MSRRQNTPNLPSGWKWVPFDEVLLNIIGGGTPSKSNPSYWSGYIPWLSVKDMKTSRPKDTIDHISLDAIENSATNLISPDTLIVSTRMGLGKIVRLPFETTINQDLKALILAKSVNKSYVEYWYISLASYIESLGTGTTVKGIRLEQLRSLKLPLAPRAIQDLVVNKIEELFSHIDTGVEGLKQAKAKLQQYRQSVLKDAVTGKLTEQWRAQNADKLEPAEQLLERILDERRANWEAEQLKAFEEKGKIPKNDKWKDKYITPKEPRSLEWLPSGWTNTVTDQVFSFVTSGSRGWAKYYSEEGALFLRVGNLFHYNVELDLRKLQRVSPPTGSEGSRTRVQEGDNLVSITADVGMVGYVPENFEEAYINQHVALARPVVTIMGKYLSWLLSGDFAKEQFKALQKGATKAGLGLDDIRSINFGLPSLQEQHQIVFEIESRISGLEKLAKEIDDKIQHASKLKSSILADAFSGQLVENHATEETAEQLLEKIHLEKGQAEQKAKLAKKKPTARVKKMKRRPILDVLMESKKALNVDELFELSGFQGEVTPEVVEEFYQELKDVTATKGVNVTPVKVGNVKQGDLFEYKEIKPNEA
ncbi:restriction endonuclease subunit S [Photobacterium leiognathi]|uniref:restriction endonuclease subunit S n=1 Tax=Photobacterium leiognathi TaxID=553611 RepID=UPI00298114FD|nr:restriction endonuclease subunit S [Photobacterium leiognathi]